MRTFNQFVGIFVKRIWAEPIFKCLHHRFCLGKLFFCLVKIVIQNPIIHVEFSFFAIINFIEIHIFPNTWNNGVGVDWIFNFPSENVFTVFSSFRNQSSVSYADQIFWSNNIHQDSIVGFVVPNVFYRQPNRSSDSFLCSGDPGISVVVFFKNPTSVPRCAFCNSWISRILNGKKMRLSFF